MTPDRGYDANLGHVGRIALINEVCWRMNSCGCDGASGQLCCWGVLVFANRMLVLVTASQWPRRQRHRSSSLDVRPHIGRRHQPHAMPERREFVRPMMRRGAGLDTNEARGKLLEERQDVAAFN